MSSRIAFADLATADLVVDAVYEGGTRGTFADEPLSHLLQVGNRGGFRAIGSPLPESCLFAVLYTRGNEPDWPDRLDPESGTFIFFGDNRRPGAELHDTPRGGNKLLRHVFGATHANPPARSSVPPFFVFELVPETGRDVRFLGLAVPGSSTIGPDDDLVALWRTRGKERFQNYRAVFTVLDIGRISRDWIDGLRQGNDPESGAPEPWLEWRASCRYSALAAPRTLNFRSREQQLPKPGSREYEILRAVWHYFSNDPYQFEVFAMWVWQAFAPRSVLEQTRPSRDGGRDAVGSLPVGPISDPVHLRFSLEAKCYEPGRNSVGVREMSRLISRIRHREFGVLVTTSFVSPQPFQELREDGHPVSVVAGADIVDTLIKKGHETPQDVLDFLERNFSLA